MLQSITIRQFTRTGAETLVAEASEVGPFIGQVWRDSCDVGIAIQGRTRKIIFTLSREERNADEIVAWHFSPYRADDQPIRKLIVFND